MGTPHATAAMSRWIDDPRAAATPIRCYVEVAGQCRVATFIRLTQSMPCCVGTDNRCCGRGTTIGGVIPQLNGTWLLLPVCAPCLRTAAGAKDGDTPNT